MQKVKLGIVGTGFIASGLAAMVRRCADFEVGAVLSRRSDRPLRDFADHELTASIDAFLARSGIIVECSGDPIHATEVIDRALKAGLPVVTMNSEWHVTVGSFFRGRGMVTEAEGDQAGCLAALREDAIAMGFCPLAFVNVKGFLNHCPTRADMEHYASKQGISLEQVTSFTDGTKLQIEQAHVANGLGCAIFTPGLLGPAVESLDESVSILASAAEALGSPIADYVLTSNSPGSVFIIARHDHEQAAALRYMKMGEGPYYLLRKPHHLCHLEILKTLRRVVSGNSILLDNGDLPAISVATVAKRDLTPGTRIARGSGSFEVRGECVRIAESQDHLPIGLMNQATIRNRVAAGDVLTMDDVELPESLALTAWMDTRKRVIESISPSRSDA